MTDRPDVRALVEGIRAEVADRRASGRLSPEDVEIEYAARLRAYIEVAKIDPRLGERLLQESFDWNIDSGYEPRSDRAGIAGTLVRIAKRAVRPFVRLYTDHIVNRQAQLNLVLWQFLLDSVRRTAALEAKMKDLRREIDDLKKRA
jgi:hypothetical protein